MSKKDLDKLFQEKFKNFEASPEPKVWRAIEASLNEKDKKRRVIPLWWKIAGAAAIVALGLFFMPPFNGSKTLSPTTVTDTEKAKELLDTKKTVPVSENNTGSKKEPIKIAEINAQKPSLEQKASKSNSLNKVNRTTYVKELPTITATTSKEPSTQQKLSAASEDQNLLEEKSTAEPQHASNAIVAGVNQNKKIPVVNNEDAARSSIKNSTKDPKNNPAVAKVTDKSTQEKDKKSIYDEIEAQKTAKEEVVNANVKSKKWSAGAAVAPVYFNAIGEGSPVGKMFVSNSKSGNTNLSYGISIAYEVNKKLSLRSGLHKVDYAYTTNNVGFSSNFNGQSNSQLNTINYDATSINLEVLSTNTNAAQASYVKDDIALDALSKNPTLEGVMSQQFNYVEVPLELKYQLVDSKLGINIIGGISSLFLIDNTVLLSAGSITTTLGEANNINSLNFSTNIGVGLQYRFTPKIELNVEPMFKYQVNTFSNIEGTFEPYSIGVYSGLTFKL